MPLFSTTFTPPAAPDGLTISTIEAAAVRLEWEPSTLVPEDFVAYHVYRSLTGQDIDYQLLASLPHQDQTTYDDYTAPIGVGLFYRVTQLSIDEESDPAEGGVELDVCEWWLVTPGAAEASFELPNVTDYGSEWPQQSEQYEPLGRAFKLVESGLLLGEEGSLSMRLTPADVSSVDRIRAAMSGVAERLLLKSPYGEVIEVNLGGLSRERHPGGYQTLDLSFTQVG